MKKPAASRAEIQRAYRERAKSAGKVIRVIDTWTTPTPSDIRKQGERLGEALIKLKVRDDEVARLMDHVASIEGERRLLEQHYTNAKKEIVMLKKQIAAMKQPEPKRRR